MIFDIKRLTVRTIYLGYSLTIYNVNRLSELNFKYFMDHIKRTIYMYRNKKQVFLAGFELNWTEGEKILTKLLCKCSCVCVHASCRPLEKI